MNTIKKIFSIKDLENLSGIKAHTIRIWEKRYNLLEPERTDTNIRLYSVQSLQKLLNITLLYNNGYKISKIAKMDDDNITMLSKTIVTENSVKNKYINAFKLAMINFDQQLFLNTYQELIATKSFREVFYELFIPLLEELGLLWQTNTITPAHEHFISNLIKQKILINTEKLQSVSTNKLAKTFVLYLPENEIHEIGLLYLNYEITLRGYHSIYLGPTMPLENLKEITSYYDNVVFLTYFTVEPIADKVNDYIESFNTELNSSKTNELWLIGRQIEHIKTNNTNTTVKTFKSIDSLVKDL